VTTVVVIGATGQLGADCLEAFATERVIGLSHEEIEIGDPASVRRALVPLAPEVVVNTAAFLDVPACERDPDRAYRLNAVAPRTIARLCAELGARLVHISTDYVFDGSKGTPYVESDRPGPLNTYAASKLAGEYEVLASDGRHQVVRSSGLYGVRPCRGKGGSFLDTILAQAARDPVVRVVNDEVLTPTWTCSLAGQLRTLALEGPGGLFHATDHGWCSWFEFTRELFALLGVRTQLEGVSARTLDSPVRRPAYSVLQNAALEALGMDRMRPWRESLAACLRRREGTVVPS